MNLLTRFSAAEMPGTEITDYLSIGILSRPKLNMPASFEVTYKITDIDFAIWQTIGYG